MGNSSFDGCGQGARKWPTQVKAWEPGSRCGARAMMNVRDSRRCFPCRRVAARLTAGGRWRTSSGSAPAGRPNGWFGPPMSTISPISSRRSTRRHVPVWPVGVGSNLIVRDGGVPGVTSACPRLREDRHRARRRPRARGRRRDGDHRRQRRARRRHRRPRIPARHSRHRRRRGPDERRRLWPRHLGHIDRGDPRAARRPRRDLAGRSSAIPIATASCPRARSSSRRCSAAARATRRDRRRDGPHRRRARGLASRCAAAPADRPSRIRTATRRGSSSTRPAAAA
jgi:hypothetical protein